MSDFFEKPYSAEDLVGEANCGVFVLSGIDTIDTLPDIPCKYAMIASWTVGVTSAIFYSLPTKSYERFF